MAEFNLWLLILGIAAGAAVTWLVIGTIARSDDEIASSEAAAEADWIARTIEEHGGRAPLLLVEQILSLHRRYLQGGSATPMPQPEHTTAAPDETAGADVNDVIRADAAAGVRELVLVPVGFICDHVEVLYDLDVEARATADEAGIRLHRAGTVGDHPRFITMLAELIGERL